MVSPSQNENKADAASTRLTSNMMNMAKLFFVLLLLTALISAASAQRCEPPSNGCTYGMYNYDKCLCECIKPFCPDANGDCVLPTDNCGGNPWEGCTRGLDCPWWGSLSNDSVCNTGSTVSLDKLSISIYMCHDLR